MAEEQRYTLAEAKQELALRECQDSGHDYDVIPVRDFGDQYDYPVAVRCRRCDTSWQVERMARW